MPNNNTVRSKKESKMPREVLILHLNDNKNAIKAQICNLCHSVVHTSCIVLALTRINSSFQDGYTALCLSYTR